MPLQNLPEKIDSKFRFVLLASHRAEQLMRGANPKQPEEGRKITRVAMEEIATDEIQWDYGPELPEEGGEALELAEEVPESPFADGESG